MVEPLELATYVLAGWTAVLAISTIVYAYYVRKQTVLMRTHQGLLSKQIAVTALTIPFAVGGSMARSIRADELKAKMRELGLPD